jgi:cell pole-organizing protein PopZ
LPWGEIVGIVTTQMHTGFLERRETMTESESVEPNLDEILASIRRIISEEGPAAAAAPILHAPRGLGGHGPDDVLILTRRAPPESPLMAWSDDHAPAAVQVDGAPIAMDPSQAPALEAPVPGPTADVCPPAGPGPDPAEAHQPQEEEVVVAPETEAKAAEAFDKLSAVANEPAPSAAMAMPAPGRTLEDVVRELMRPMLAEWLDENLPAIVQARVDQEIERITRHRVR